MAQLRSVTCHMGSHSVTYHPTQVDTPRLNPSQTGPVLDLFTPEGWKTEWTYSWLDSAVDGSRTSDLSITSPTFNNCTTKTTFARGCAANTGGIFPAAPVELAPVCLAPEPAKQLVLARDCRSLLLQPVRINKSISKMTGIRSAKRLISTWVLWQLVGFVRVRWSATQMKRASPAAGKLQLPSYTRVHQTVLCRRR